MTSMLLFDVFECKNNMKTGEIEEMGDWGILYIPASVVLLTM